MEVERVDFVSFLTHGNVLMLHRRYAPFADGRQP
jgi:hypothetical protein